MQLFEYWYQSSLVPYGVWSYTWLHRCVMVSERHKSSLYLGIYKVLCNHCFLIRRHHDVALPRRRSHDILLFSSRLKSAGKVLWSSIPVITNSAAMRCFSEAAAETEQSQQAPVALSPAHQGRAAQWGSIPCALLSCPSIWEPQEKRGWLPVGTQPGNRVTGPLPQTPEQQSLPWHSWEQLHLL